MPSSVDTFDPTPEQASIVEAVRTTSANLAVKALAGAAKTSTIVLAAKALRGTPCLALAFNKRIADELTARLPSHVKAATLNSLGHRAWSDQIGSNRLHVDSRKTGRLLTAQFPGRLPKPVSDAYGDIMKLVGLAKSYGYIPDGCTYQHDPVCTDRETFESIARDELDPEPLAWDYLDGLLLASIAESFGGSIDFADQLYMSTLFGGTFPKFPVTFVDEAQDLSALNHRMLSKLVGTRRLIAVGDPYQSIYGFRGAVADSMDLLADEFKMQWFPLSVSFRCAKSIVALARTRARDMQAWDQSPEGEVKNLASWSYDSIPDGTAVICRNNAPLFRLGLTLLRHGRPCNLKGFDLSRSLIKLLDKLGDATTPTADALFQLDQHITRSIASREASEGLLRDRQECIEAFFANADNIGQARAAAQALFNAEGGIELISGHKSKGLEWDEVWHLDPWRIPSKYATTKEQRTQERNVRYVITTRARTRLVLFNMDDLDRGDA